MRKSGPFRSIKLCAYTSVGADSRDIGTPFGANGVLDATLDDEEVSETVGSLASLVDRKCQTSNISKTIRADPRTASWTRIRNYSRGTVVPRTHILLPMGVRTSQKYGVEVAEREPSKTIPDYSGSAAPRGWEGVKVRLWIDFWMPPGRAWASAS